MSSPESRTTIIVALISLVSATAVAFIANIDKIWRPERPGQDSVVVPGPQPIPQPQPTKGSASGPESAGASPGSAGTVNEPKNAAINEPDVEKVKRSLRTFTDFRSDTATLEDAKRMLLKAGLTHVSVDHVSRVVTGQIDDTLSIKLWPGSSNQKNAFGVRYGTNAPSSNWQSTYFDVVIPVTASAP